MKPETGKAAILAAEGTQPAKEGRYAAMSQKVRITSRQLLHMIERIVADDFCEDFDCMAAFHPDELTEREKTAHNKLSIIYRLVHSLDKSHSCHHVHTKWRKEVFQMLQATNQEIAESDPGPRKEG